MKRVLIGVTGGIAAYKTASVVSALKQAGHDVQVAMTPAACRFVTPLTFAALSLKEVRTELFPEHPASDKGQLYPHLYPATEADLFAVLPATADIIGKLAAGFGDDIVSAGALSLSRKCVKFFCPAMNTQMWDNPVVQKNIQTLEKQGWRRIGPGSGLLACGTEGTGRMAEPAEILDVINKALA
ncbi:MAG: phosphopantothenoylcysteine decarboxylase [Verrucomicrobiota bacterium]|jgi:phosphopantothenoylcysteine decarboxylase/phosphopantothenate--cysteine ligase|nr:phosphopantothenoylcysteine decarboxylase [Verrucomicrobiota bacterium]MDK2963120.1 phosphopantothenoylcysteine decarboxylase [Verrucomicrobiota bacterium]